jgi:hypothetical protein
MTKRAIVLAILLSLLLVTGCTEAIGPAGQGSPAAPEIIRKAELASDWQMSQMRVDLDSGEELSILLRLANGDEIDGYFYLERGERITFEIQGNSLVYRSRTEQPTVSVEVASDRFSFIAEQGQGNTYTLTFSNPSGDDGSPRATVFMELIYPVTASVYVPIEVE